MTVALNARAAVRAEIGGVERYALELSERLPALGDYRVIRPPRALAHRAGHAWEQAFLPLAARGCELIYSPANLAPVAGGRNVVVIHDLAAIRHPEWYGRAYSTWQRALLPALARRARLVIAPSEFSRGEIADLLGAERVEVVPGGVSERFTPDARAPERRPYVLTVATRSARKNLAALTAARDALAARGIDLLAAGSGRGYLRAGDGPDTATPLGYVPEADLPGLYAGARAFVLPSLYEGFGLPCLEAMASGVPVVAADRGALPETCGGAALLVDPGDAAAVAEAVLAATTDEPLRARLIAAGRERAGAFSWERSAGVTHALLESVVAGRT